MRFVFCTRLSPLEAARRHRGSIWAELAATSSDLKQLITQACVREGLSRDRQLYSESHSQAITPKAREGHSMSPRTSMALRSLQPQPGWLPLGTRL